MQISVRSVSNCHYFVKQWHTLVGMIAVGAILQKHLSTITLHQRFLKENILMLDNCTKESKEQEKFLHPQFKTSKGTVVPKWESTKPILCSE